MKILLSFIGIALYVVFILHMSISPTNLLPQISLNNIEALASGETDEPSPDLKLVQCEPGTKTTNITYPEKRWCGDCKSYRIISTGEGHCRTIL